MKPETKSYLSHAGPDGKKFPTYPPVENNHPGASSQLNLRQIRALERLASALEDLVVILKQDRDDTFKHRQEQRNQRHTRKQR